MKLVVVILGALTAVLNAFDIFKISQELLRLNNQKAMMNDLFGNPGVKTPDIVGMAQSMGLMPSTGTIALYLGLLLVGALLAGWGAYAALKQWEQTSKRKKPSLALIVAGGCNILAAITSPIGSVFLNGAPALVAGILLHVENSKQAKKE